MKAGGILQEKETFFGVIADAVAYAKREGRVSEKKLKSALGVHLPTASKAVCALLLMGVVGRREGKYYPYVGKGDEEAKVRARAEGYAQDYLPLAEEDKAFRSVGTDGYMTGTLLPAIKTGTMFGSLSVIFLERKLSVGYERAHEIYDIIAACGLLGDEDEINPGRRKMTVGFADYDALYARLVEA